MSQIKFKEITSENENLSSIFYTNDDLNTCARKFIKKLNDCIYKCFRKIRISDRPNKEIKKLFEKRKILRGKSDENSKDELEEVEENLAEMCAESNYNKIMEEISQIDCEE